MTALELMGGLVSSAKQEMDQSGLECIHCVCAGHVTLPIMDRDGLTMRLGSVYEKMAGEKV